MKKKRNIVKGVLILGLLGMGLGAGMLGPNGRQGIYDYVTGRRIDESRYTSASLEEVLTHPEQYEGKWVKIPHVQVNYLHGEVPSATLNSFLIDLDSKEDNYLSVEITHEKVRNRITCTFSSDGKGSDYQKAIALIKEGEVKDAYIRGEFQSDPLMKNFKKIDGHSLDIVQKDGTTKTFYLSD